ncbi:MAG: phytanoyl-CoA dioxygenase family protein [Chitinophagales bacterium]|nr:phytanoyl-CoA dioxygenase family protein [Chitinophagales bacterium]
MQILKNDEAQKEISEKGFTIFDILEASITERLSSHYHSLSSPFQTGFHPSMFWQNTQTKFEISQLICKELEPWVEEHFIGYRLLYGNFMVKEPGKESIMKLHQDWSYVDEEFEQSFAIWFPLQDLTDSNGALSMIPRSHFSKNHHRGPGTHCPFLENEDYIIENFGQALYLKKGQPVVWEHHLLHYSPPNLSTSPRIAVTAIIVPKDQPIYHYFQQDSDADIEQYQIEPQFYFNYNIGKRPKYHSQLVQNFSPIKQTYSIKEINQLLGKAENKKFNYIQKLKKIFS